MDDGDSVAALQAITVYFLLRLSEKDEEATNFDIPLVQTMVVCHMSSSIALLARIFVVNLSSFWGK